MLSPPDDNEDDTDEDKFPCEFDWLFILGGLVSGLLVGFVMGDIFTDRHPWLIYIIVHRFGKIQKKQDAEEVDHSGERSRFAKTGT